MTDNHTSRAASELLEMEQSYEFLHGCKDCADLRGCGNHSEWYEMLEKKFPAIAQKYAEMERAHEAISNGECHPSQIEKGDRQCHAKKVGDCCCSCARIWSEFALFHDPLAQ